MGRKDCGYGFSYSMPKTYAAFVAQYSLAVAEESCVATKPSSKAMLMRGTPSAALLWGKSQFRSMGQELSSVTEEYARRGDADAVSALAEQRSLPPLPSFQDVLLLGFPSRLEHQRHQHEDMDVAVRRVRLKCSSGPFVPGGSLRI